MSDDSDSVVSLPQGGGAIQGIGEKFSPDVFTGTGNFSVPIALPPGRGGFQPKLSLAYSTGAGNGPYGLGWSIGIPGVSRKTSAGIPVYDDDADVFILSGSEDLVPMPGGVAGAARYRPRTEGIFARITHVKGSLGDYWEVASKDGLISRYGTKVVGGAPAGWVDPAVVADPSDSSRIFTWNLTETIDPFGNRIEYSWRRDPSGAALYPSSVRYVDYGDPSAPQFLVQVLFSYDPRPDAYSRFRSGFEIRSTLRCSGIQVVAGPNATQPQKSYQLAYVDALADPNRPAALNGVSLLGRVTVVGVDATQTPPATESLPPLDFTYTGYSPQSRRAARASGRDFPAGSLSSAGLALVDVLGDGLPSLVELDATARYWRNAGQGTFDLARTMPSAPAGVSLGSPGVQLLDADGDGRLDLVVMNQTVAGYYPMTFDGLWEKSSFRLYAAAPSVDFSDPQVRLIDLDGDGVTDAMRAGDMLECFFNDRDLGWHKTALLDLPGPDVDFTDPRVLLADMTGDGLQDIVVVENGSVRYYPSLGRGRFGSGVRMASSPRLPLGFNPKRLLLGDVDGDGAADLLYVEDGLVTLWINQSGGSWSAPIQIRGTPPVDDADSLRLVDLFGLGVSGVLWSSSGFDVSLQRMFFLDLCGGAKPYLLSGMDNHMGAVTSVTYAPSTRDYLADYRNPSTRWKTRIPFPVQVVASVAVSDLVSGGTLTTEYTYHHGYWDGYEREFRGFGRVDQRDAEAFTAGGAPTTSFSPPTEMRRWFHQGPIVGGDGGWAETDYRGEYWAEPWPSSSAPSSSGVLTRPPDSVAWLAALGDGDRRDALRAMRGSLLRSELYALDASARAARPYTVTEGLFGVAEVLEDAAGEPLLWSSGSVPTAGVAPHGPQKVYFPSSLAQRTTQWERGAEPMSRFDFTDGFDRYGQPTSKTAVAVPRGRDFLVALAAPPPEPYLVTRATTSYASPTAAAFIVDRVSAADSEEVVNDGKEDVFSLHAAIAASDPSLTFNLVGSARTYYDGPAFTGLALGQVGLYGASSRTEALIATDAILGQAYPEGIPPYLQAATPAPWPSEYPVGFRASLPVSSTTDPTRPGLAILMNGWGFADGTSAGAARGYYAASRRAYDFQTGSGGRGLVVAKRDALGREQTSTYDAYQLFTTTTTDAAGLAAQTVYDYRVFQPSLVTDPNGNRKSYVYSPLGLLSACLVMGKAGSSDGDTPEKPSLSFVYHLGAFFDGGQPVSATTIKRIHHAGEVNVPPTEADATIQSIVFSDGFGRKLQTRVQADDVVFDDAAYGDAGLPAAADGPGSAAVGVSAANRVLVSGWQVYNNKGWVVGKYEPFYDAGWAYAQPTTDQLGEMISIDYDPRGQAVRTTNPDGSQQIVVTGVPGTIAAPDLSDPSVYEPTPWEIYTYDANDNAGRTDPQGSAAYSDHWNTAASVVIDALGRTARKTVRNSLDPNVGAFTSTTTYDIRGNPLLVRDELGRAASQHVYDLANKPLRSTSLDGGTSRAAMDAAGKTLEGRDARGAMTLSAFDVLGRPAQVWARDDAAAATVVAQIFVYGDAGDPNQPLAARQAAAAANSLGRLAQTYDGAGLSTAALYDFKGNLLQSTRQAIGDAALAAPIASAAGSGWSISAFRMDWTPPAGTTLAAYAQSILDPTIYQTDTAYDALNRAQSIALPQDVAGARRIAVPSYNSAGLLAAMQVDGQTYVSRLAYNAKGLRVLIAYGNGVMTRYAYDPKTFRLLRMRTEPFTQPAGEALTYAPGAAGGVLQDHFYAYDLAGNLLGLLDETPSSGVANTAEGADALSRAFLYDPLYRLISATGRECTATAAPRPWGDLPRCGYYTGGTPSPTQSNAPSLTTPYTETYAYDPAGNMTRLSHATQAQTWTRSFGVGGQTPAQWAALWPTKLNAGAWNSAPGNQLTHAGDDEDSFAATHVFDAAGNLISENGTRLFEWDYSGRMKSFRVQTPGAEPSVYAEYLYDSSGQRVKKYVRLQGGAVRVTVYASGGFEHSWETTPTGTRTANNTIHAMDDKKRVALIRIGPALSNDPSPSVQYQFADHLGSSAVVVDGTGAWIVREEFYPYGETSFGGFSRKRYRFTGQERDEESGLGYHSARYLASWLCRWISRDPAGYGDGLNLFVFSRNNPICLIDPSGCAADAPPVQPPVGDVYDWAEFHVKQAFFQAGRELGERIPNSRSESIQYSSEQGSLASKYLRDNVIELSNSSPPGSEAQRLVPEVAIDQSGKIIRVHTEPGGTGLGTRQPDLLALKEPLPASEHASLPGQQVSEVGERFLDAKGGNGSIAGKADLEEMSGLPVRAVRPFSNLNTKGLSPSNDRLAMNSESDSSESGSASTTAAIGMAATALAGVAIERLVPKEHQELAVAATTVIIGATTEMVQGVGVSGTVAAARFAVSTAGEGLAAAAPVIAEGGLVLGAGAAGYAVGTVVNKYVAEPLLDKAAPGSGAVGQLYYNLFLK